MNKIIKLLVLLGLGMAASLTASSQVSLRFRDTSAAINTFINIPVYSNATLSGQGVVSYSLKFSFNPSQFQPEGVVTTGTISETAGTPLVNTSTPGFITIAAAGTMPLSGTGIFIYLRFKIIAGGTSFISNTGVNDNYVNEGNPALTFTNSCGLTGITPPVINVSPSSLIMMKGETQQFTASGGTAPYGWNSSNTSVATISSGGLLTANAIGFTNVKATDVNTNSGQANNIEVRGYRLRIPDTTGIYNTFMNIPVYVSDLTGLNALSGTFNLNYNSNSISNLEIVTANSLLQSVSNTVSNLNNLNTIQVSFVNTTPLNNSGVLFWIRCKLFNVFGANSHFTFTSAVINEDFVALSRGGSVSYTQPANISVTAPANFLVYGDSLKFTVSNNATGPFNYSVSNPSLATISSNGYLKVLQSGQVTVNVTDANNAFATSALIQLYDTYLKISDTLAVHGTQVEIPVSIRSLPPGQSVYSIEGRIMISGTQAFIPQDIETSGTATATFSKTTSAGLNYLQFALAGVNPAPGNTVLFRIKGTVNPAVAVGNTSGISFQNLLINEGQPLALVQNGSVKSAPPPVTYTFTGNGNWNVAANWANGVIPPANLTNLDQIIIDPVAGGECVLNVSQTITAGPKVTVTAGKKLRIVGSLTINKTN